MRAALKTRLARLEWGAMRASGVDLLADLLFDMQMRTPVVDASKEHAAALADPIRSACLIVIKPDQSGPENPVL